ncbi:hypothetical protein DFH27DRAFT_387681 [Peziza echinospora]|nr:hypothetical protein DFH27DRAFT_387681 [Peziza echinospora]
MANVTLTKTTSSSTVSNINTNPNNSNSNSKSDFLTASTSKPAAGGPRTILANFQQLLKAIIQALRLFVVSSTPDKKLSRNNKKGTTTTSTTNINKKKQQFDAVGISSNGGDITPTTGEKPEFTTPCTMYDPKSPPQDFAQLIPSPGITPEAYNRARKVIGHFAWRIHTNLDVHAPRAVRSLCSLYCTSPPQPSRTTPSSRSTPSSPWGRSAWRHHTQSTSRPPAKPPSRTSTPRSTQA